MGTVTYDFTAKTVLVTGGSRGIGFGVAKGFARAGADVVILSGGEDGGEAAQALRAFGRVRAVRADITKRDQIIAALEGIEKIDVLVNNAGLERITPIDDPDDTVEATFARIIDINVNGTFLMTRHALPKMGAGGRIILTASIWSRTAVPELSAYVSSKHANLGFMRSIAHELGLRGINVNAVCPGWVRTEAAMLSLSKMAQATGRPEAELLDEITGAQVLGGLLEPDDMAALYLFLASDAARDITGQAYMLDRGEVMA
jgi:3-hydroxybutyrate dehydrogenase